ncbi:MAG: TldD/PmbA family protein [Clostridiales bacterium]|nr:TldD/PmbA family protein [Clostridiales bacterium]
MREKFDPPNLFIDSLLDHSKSSGFMESEVYYSAQESTELSVHEHKIDSFESSFTSGISFRGRVSDQMGYAFSEVYDDDVKTFLLEKARENGSVIETKDSETLFEGESKYPVVDNFSDELDKKSFEYFSDTALSIEQAILDYDPRVVAVDDLYLSYGVGSQAIRNTLGMDCKSFSNALSIYAGSRSFSGGQTKTGYTVWSGRNIESLNIEDLARKAAEDSLNKLGASPIHSGNYSVILDARAAADMLSVFSGVFSAEMVQKGFSLLDGKSGRRIASDCIELRDDGILPSSLFSYPFDSEGVVTTNMKLIDKGILTSFLHNRKTAAVYGVDSTGNGFRSGYKGSIDIAATNFYFAPGDTSRFELLKKMGSGLIIKNLSGLHAGANEISGDFSLSCDGYYVSNGEIEKPVDQITVSGNFFKLLQSVVSVSDDLYFSPPSGNGIIGSPSLFIENICISGD